MKERRYQIGDVFKSTKQLDRLDNGLGGFVHIEIIEHIDDGLYLIYRRVPFENVLVTIQESRIDENYTLIQRRIDIPLPAESFVVDSKFKPGELLDIKDVPISDMMVIVWCVWKNKDGVIKYLVFYANDTSNCNIFSEEEMTLHFNKV